MKWVTLAVLAFLITVYLRRLVLGSPLRRREKPEPQGPDPYTVLGISRDASDDEIAQAYREQMKRYHPDRVADLGDELQRVAHDKTVEIQRAYDRLRK